LDLGWQHCKVVSNSFYSTAAFLDGFIRAVKIEQARL
jgi:hypothetical protein